MQIQEITDAASGWTMDQIQGLSPAACAGFGANQVSDILPRAVSGFYFNCVTNFEDDALRFVCNSSSFTVTHIVFYKISSVQLISFSPYAVAAFSAAMIDNLNDNACQGK